MLRVVKCICYIIHINVVSFLYLLPRHPLTDSVIFFSCSSTLTTSLSHNAAENPTRLFNKISNRQSYALQLFYRILYLIIYRKYTISSFHTGLMCLASPRAKGDLDRFSRFCTAATRAVPQRFWDELLTKCFIKCLCLYLYFYLYFHVIVVTVSYTRFCVTLLELSCVFCCI